MHFSSYIAYCWQGKPKFSVSNFSCKRLQLLYNFLLIGEVETVNLLNSYSDSRNSVEYFREIFITGLKSSSGTYKSCCYEMHPTSRNTNFIDNKQRSSV